MADLVMLAGPGSLFWLNDSRRIVYFRPTKDNRSIYYTRTNHEFDIWLMQLK